MAWEMTFPPSHLPSCSEKLSIKKKDTTKQQRWSPQCCTDEHSPKAAVLCQFSKLCEGSPQSSREEQNPQNCSMRSILEAMWKQSSQIQRWRNSSTS